MRSVRRGLQCLRASRAVAVLDVMIGPALDRAGCRSLVSTSRRSSALLADAARVIDAQIAAV